VKEVAQTGVAQAALQVALYALEDIRHPLGFSKAKEVLKPLARKAGVSPNAFTRKVLDEARRWTEGVLDGFWEALGVASPPAEVAEALKERGRVKLWCPWGRKGPLGTVSAFVQVSSGDRYLRKELDLPLPGPACPKTFVLHAHAGRVEVDIPPRFFARKERALFRTRDPRRINKTLGEVAPLRPLLEAMGLPGLEEALEALAGLKNGEIRQKGPYLLVRKGRLRALKRGSYFDNPALDAAFLVGERVVLAYENGVEVALKGIFSAGSLLLEEASIRWGNEIAHLETASWVSTDALSEIAPSHLFRTFLSWDVEKGFPGRSSEMKVLIAELASDQDPLEALKDEDFLRRVWLSHLARF
jgi:hypothetical protein